MQADKDIRSIRYNRKSTIDDINFQGAQAGQRLIWKIITASVGVIVTFACSLVPVMSGALFATIIVFFGIGKIYTLGIGIILYISAVFVLVIRGLEAVSIVIIFIATLTSIVAPIIDLNPDPAGFILFLSLGIFSAWLGEIITAYCLTFTYISGGIIIKYLALIGSGLSTIIAVKVWITSAEKLRPGEGAATIFAAFTIIITGAIIAQQAARGSPKFAWIREKAVFWAAIGGTSFYEVDLTDACFDDADLRHTDFRKANLTRTSFKGVTGLELARLQGTILEQPRVRKLLTTHNGCGENFTEADLCGANLRGANLREAILVKAQVLDADFSRAILTDACIQDWNINHNTRFQDVDCQRVYLKCSKHGHFLEPKPDSGEFKPGEFEKWITDVRDTIDLIFQNGLNWRAFAFSLAQTAINNDGLGLSVRSIENKGDGVVVAKVGFSVETNKTAIHEEITNHYNDAVKAIEARYELVLKAKDGEIERLRTFYESQQQFIQGLVAGIAEPTGKVHIQGEGNRVYVMDRAGDIMESKNQNVKAGGNIDMSSGAKVTAGRDISGASLTLGDYNTQVGNTIQQLKEASTDKSDELAEILAALQKSVADDTALSESQKKEALEAVETLAEEGKKPSEQRVIKLCSMAVNALKGVTTAVSDASKLAEVLTTHLPTLTKLLGI